MALILKDRVRETSTTTGTGTLTLNGAPTGFRTFSSAVGNGNTTKYTIEGKNSAGEFTGQWEVGLGTVAAGTLARTSVEQSSNSNALVNFTSASLSVFCTITGTDATGLTDSGTTSLHTHDHNTLTSLQGGTTNEYYHLTAAQHSNLHDPVTVTDSATIDFTLTGQNITGSVIAVPVANEASDTTCFPLFVTAATGDLAPKSNTSLTFNSSTGVLGASNLSGTNTGDVTLAGTPDYITISGQVITRGPIDLATDVTGDLPFSNLTQGSALSVLGVTGNATADVASIAAGTDNQVLRRSGTSLAFGAVNLASSNAVTGDLPFANLAQLSANSVFANPTTGTADGQALSVAANSIVGRITGGNVDDTQVAFGLSFDSTSLRINLAETKFDWTGDHHFRDQMLRLWNPAVTAEYTIRTSAISAARDITIPALAASDTLVFQAHAQDITGKTLIAVDNLQLDGNTLSSTNTNGNIVLDPNGTGSVVMGASATQTWSVDSVGMLAPATGTGAYYGVPLDWYAFVAQGLAAGLFFTASGIPGYDFLDIIGGALARIDVSGSESYYHTQYGYSSALATPTQLTADTNNWALIANNNGLFYRISSDASRAVTGIVAPTNANRAVWKTLVNVGSNNITFNHENASSTAANRIITTTAATITLAPAGAADMFYDYTSSRWRIYLRN